MIMMMLGLLLLVKIREVLVGDAVNAGDVAAVDVGDAAAADVDDNDAADVDGATAACRNGVVLLRGELVASAHIMFSVRQHCSFVFVSVTSRVTAFPRLNLVRNLVPASSPHAR